MKEIIFKDKNYQDRFNYHLLKEGTKLKDDQYLLIKMIIIHYKNYSSDEYYLFLALLRGLTFFKCMDLDSEDISDTDRKNLKILSESLNYELSGKKDEFIDSVLKMDDNLFLLKMIIKFTILSFEDKYINLIPNIKEYYKSIGYIIPFLTLKEFNLLGFFQDVYFEKNYPREFNYTQKHYFKKINNTTISGEYMVYVINNLSELMTKSGVVGKIKLRKKTFFSVYNKLLRKGTKKIDDSIGIRIIFSSLEEINKFVLAFEEITFFVKKKDYIFKPKKNGYQSIHYTYLSPYKDRELKIDLQIRTDKIDEQIKNTVSLCHYNYTLKENKWASIFKEVHYGYNYINEIKNT